MIQVQILDLDRHTLYEGHTWSVTFIKVIWGQLTSSEITNRFLLTIHDWKELQTWAWSHCVRLVKTHRLICSTTYLGQPCYLTWPWPEIKFWPDFIRSPDTFFDAPWRAEHDGAWIKPLACLVRILLATKNFLPKRLFWRFLPLAAKSLVLAQVWLHISERTAQELSNIFSRHRT